MTLAITSCYLHIPTSCALCYSTNTTAWETAHHNHILPLFASTKFIKFISQFTKKGLGLNRMLTARNRFTTFRLRYSRPSLARPTLFDLRLLDTALYYCSR